MGRRLSQGTYRCPPPQGADVRQREQTAYGGGGVCLGIPALQAAPQGWQETLKHPTASGREEMETMEVNSSGR